MILQLGVFLLGFVSVVGTHAFVMSRIDELERYYSNEQSRLMLAEQINLDLISIESKFYEIAISTSKRRQGQIRDAIIEEIHDSREVLGVLEKGGSYQRVINVNLEYHEQVSDSIVYKRWPGDSEYVVEVIDLLPKLAEIERRVDELVGLVSLREDHRHGKRAGQYVAVISDIKSYLKQIPPLFRRMQENTNKIHAESILRFNELDQLNEKRRKRYQVIEMSVSAITVVLVILFGLAISRRVNRTNKALGSAIGRSEMLKNEAEEAQRHNAVINRILEVSIQGLPLQETLEKVLEQIVSVSWLKIEAQGSIFIADNNRRCLVLAAHHRLAPALQEKCVRISYGECLCGRAAESGEVVFSSHVDDRHEISYPSMHRHGHICFPVRSAGQLLGILNLYV
ncbi:MAG: GAF domain-containing protein, partial [Acidobacteriota bacterium]